jgi:type I restriction enzyme M protein
MADERSRPPHKQPSPIPAAYAWPSLLARDGDALFDHYRHTLEELGRQPGALALIFGKAQNKFREAKLRCVIVDLIDNEVAVQANVSAANVKARSASRNHAENWSAMGADVKGDAYEGLLERNAQDIKSGAGQYFTPRALIQAMVDCIAPRPGEVICDPACGTGGFLFTAHQYLTHHYPNLTRDEKRHLKEGAFRGWELVQATARVCAMNLMLHGIGSEKSVPIKVADALAADPGERFDVVLANPPFGKKSSTMIVGEDGRATTEKDIVERDDFWATTSNKQLNFGSGRRVPRLNVRCAHVSLRRNFVVCSTSRRCSSPTAAPRWWCPWVYVNERAVRRRRRRDHPQEAHARVRRAHPAAPAHGPVLRAGRQGQRDLLRKRSFGEANVSAANVQARSAGRSHKKPASETPWTKKLWIYDLRTNKHFTLKTNPLKRADLDEFVRLYNPANRHDRKPTWFDERTPSPRPSPADAGEGEVGAKGRWRVYDYDELVARDKASLEFFSLKDESLADSDNLPPPEVIAQEIVEDLEAALEQFRLIAADLGRDAAEAS